MMKKNLLMFFFVLSSTFLFGQWDPEFCFPDCSESRLKSLNDPKYLKLKSDVKKQLEVSWCSVEKIDLLMDLVLITHPKECVDIGAFTGSTVFPVAMALKYLKKGKIYAIDAWSNEEAIKNLDEDDPNRAWWATVDMSGVYKSFLKLINSWALGTYCIPLKLTSENAIQQVDNITFLHLDGDFSEQGSLNDVNLYLPKVKSGGYVLLSNLFILVKGNYSKIKSYCKILESCDMIYEIENENAILFRKR